MNELSHVGTRNDCRRLSFGGEQQREKGKPHNARIHPGVGSD